MRRFDGSSVFIQSRFPLGSFSRNKAVEIIESLVQWHVCDWFGPVAIVAVAGELHAEVPLAYHSGVISTVSKQGGNGHSSFLNQAGCFGSKDSGLQSGSPRVATGQEAVSAGSADRVGTMRVGERHAFMGEAIERRGREFRIRIEATGIAVALVIGVDEKNVRFLGSVQGDCNEK